MKMTAVKRESERKAKNLPLRHFYRSPLGLLEDIRTTTEAPLACCLAVPLDRAHANRYNLFCLQYGKFCDRVSTTSDDLALKAKDPLRAVLKARLEADVFRSDVLRETFPS